MRCHAVAIAVFFVLGILGVPPASQAQGSGRVPRIGILRPGSAPDPYVEAFRRGLRELGYIEGQNITLEYRWAEGKSERLAALATELARSADVIMTAGEAATRAAKQATTSVPIVFAASSDPVGNGLVASLARPGGNVTGLSLQFTELVGKQLQLFKEAVPNVSRIALLGDSKRIGVQLRLREATTAAGAWGLALLPVNLGASDPVEKAFGVMGKERVDAIMVFSDSVNAARRQQVLSLITRTRLPAMYDAREWVEGGGLMAYGPQIRDMFRRAATLVDKILRGAKPAELPVEQPRTFELLVNLRTAKALGLTLPPSLVQRADQVIE